MYRHAYSGKVHVVPDGSECINVFSFRDYNSPLLHAVCCDDAYRVSQGFSLTKEVLTEKLGIEVNF